MNRPATYAHNGTLVQTSVAPFDGAPDLNVLRTAKMALDGGLITTGDYETVKTAFLRVSKAKVDADTRAINQEAYTDANQALMQALDRFGVGSGNAAPALQAAQPVSAMPSPRVSEEGLPAAAMSTDLASNMSPKPGTFSRRGLLGCHDSSDC